MKAISQAVHAQHDSAARLKFGTLIQRNYGAAGFADSTPFQLEDAEAGAGSEA